MKNLKHSKYKNTAILFEMLVRKLTSETLTSDKTVTVDIIKKYFGKNTALSKELQLYNSLIKESLKSEAQALDFIRTCKDAHSKLNKSLLRRQRYNLVKEISENFDFQKVSKIRINNYKELASIYKLFEYDEADNPKDLLECKTSIVSHLLGETKQSLKLSPLLEKYKGYKKDVRILTYKLLVDKFNSKYSGLDENQKKVLNKYITHVNDSESVKQYFEKIIPGIKSQLKEQVSLITDKATKIKVDKLSEMLCNVETIKTIKESHVLTILRYYDLIKELKEVNSK
jgi:hypothetical protein|tara:strand:+ start:215 stop:1069 length:855 start_codon:yes stop_codon:yes gene_type:complete